jgi:putative hydrolase of the HAD superfamily
MTKQFLTTIFIDAGYTLIYDDPSYEDTCAEFIRSRGVEPDLAAMRLLREQSGDALERNLRRPDLYANDERIRDLWRMYFGDLVAAGAPSLQGVAYDLGGAVFDAYNPGQRPRWAVFPEVVEALTVLCEAGFGLHVASDWSSYLPETLRSVHLDHFFHDLHISSLMGLTKNSPEFYATALLKSGLAASEVVMMGDSCVRDVEVPRSVGISAFLIDRTQDGHSGHSQAAFPDLRSVALHIREQYAAARRV